MLFKGIEIGEFVLPVLDKSFVPLSRFFSAFKDATKPISIAIERANGNISVYDTAIFATRDSKEADLYYIERLVKFLLWCKGGYKVHICGDEEVFNHIKSCYCATGARAFDAKFMSRIYEQEFSVLFCEKEAFPAQNEQSKPVGKNTQGYRIGFDAGGSDRKVSAVVNGEAIFSEEVVWFPKENSDPAYHYEGIVNAFKTAASKMPRVDAIGISSAGIFVDNRTMAASLFLKVSDEDFDRYVKDIYIRAAKEIGDVPIEVANDGDVTALAGAIGLADNSVLGIAMGTSEAVGYVDCKGNITGWLNELAFAPVDGNSDALVDEWSKDIGCGVKYFSQDSVIKLAGYAGLTLNGKSPAEKLKEVQRLMAADDEIAIQIFESIGVYLANAVALYSLFYDIKHILMLGRVMSAKGGDVILEVCEKVLRAQYPEISFKVETPDEKTRRVGQSVAAARLV